MYIQPGTILQSTAALNGTEFENSLIVITEYNDNGAIGFVINKIFERPLNALQEFSHIRHFNLYDGGPVDKEHLFFIHRRNDIVKEGSLVVGNIYVGGNFTQAVQAINNYAIIESDIKIFIGYCGWDAGELEAEITEGSWIVTNNNTAAIFSTYL
jgi:putative transcriptional regulator